MCGIPLQNKKKFFLATDDPEWFERTAQRVKLQYSLKKNATASSVDKVKSVVEP